MDEPSPFDRGYADYSRNVAPPPFPTPTTDWAGRLYNRGWEAARRDSSLTSGGSREA
jgi:hypothetical protein